MSGHEVDKYLWVYLFAFTFDNLDAHLSVQGLLNEEPSKLCVCPPLDDRPSSLNRLVQLTTVSWYEHELTEFTHNCISVFPMMCGMIIFTNVIVLMLLTYHQDWFGVST